MINKSVVFVKKKIDRRMLYLSWHGRGMGQFASVRTMVNMSLQNGLVICMQMLMQLMTPASISFIS